MTWYECSNQTVTSLQKYQMTFDMKKEVQKPLRLELWRLCIGKRRLWWLGQIANMDLVALVHHTLEYAHETSLRSVARQQITSNRLEYEMGWITWDGEKTMTVRNHAITNKKCFPIIYIRYILVSHYIY